MEQKPGRHHLHQVNKDKSLTTRHIFIKSCLIEAENITCVVVLPRLQKLSLITSKHHINPHQRIFCLPQP